jgi:predicted ATP-dependent protease
LEIIRKDLLSEEAIEIFVHETKLALKERQAEHRPDAKAYERRLEEAERQIANIIDAISKGIITPTTKEALQKAEAEQMAAQQILQARAQASELVSTVLPHAAERYRAMVKNLGRTLSTDVAQAREHIKGLLGYIRLVPSAGGSFLEAELRHSAEGLLKMSHLKLEWLRGRDLVQTLIISHRH